MQFAPPPPPPGGHFCICKKVRRTLLDGDGSGSHSDTKPDLPLFLSVAGGRLDLNGRAVIDIPNALELRFKKHCHKMMEPNLTDPFSSFGVYSIPVIQFIQILDLYMHCV